MDDEIDFKNQNKILEGTLLHASRANPVLACGLADPVLFMRRICSVNPPSLAFGFRIVFTYLFYYLINDTQLKNYV